MTAQVVQVSKGIARSLIRANSNHSEEDILEVVETSSEIWAGYWNGDLVNLWGIVPDSLIADTAYLWMFETHRIKDYRVAAARHSCETIQDLLQRYSVLWGYTTRASFRWLGWLGAKFTGVNNGHIRFEIRRG
jgi:hypothetical protein